MKDFNTDFDTEVLERSQEVPVLVDFWSPTCGPCLFLAPVLEKLEGNDDGKWELVKVNTMHHGQLSQEQGISSIPHVKLFYKGKVVSEFVGALPEGTLVKWLDEFIPTERKEELQAILERLGGEEHGQALEDLTAFAKLNPDLPMARLTLASEWVMNEPEAALTLIDDIKEGDLFYEAAENIRILGELVQFESEATEPAIEKIKAAREAIIARDFEAAIALMIEAVELDKEAAGDLPRRGTIALFRMFGPQHPLTMQYRRKFEMALY
ncbi:MAG TPA: tetratricopeptide repeat protein [Bacteroidetes bacterium]|nr:tetratricopeptide repeat protein [Bacteroidota bacterium]